MAEAKRESKLGEVLAPIAGKIAAQRHLCAVKDGVMMTIPFTIIGSIMMILAQPPVNGIEGTNFFFSFLLGWKAWATANYLTLMQPYYFTMGLISVIAVVGTAYSLAGHYKINQLTSSLTALITFLMVASPFEMTKDKPSRLIMSTTFLDAKGLFAGLIIALVTVEIMRSFFARNIKIKMPASVPPMVSAPFEALIPSAVCMGLFFFINLALMRLIKVSLPVAIIGLFRPLVAGVGSLPGLLCVYLLLNGLWILGVHGGAVVIAIVMPVMLTNTALNAELMMKGVKGTAVFTAVFHQYFGNIGGSGAAIGLGIALLLVAKSSQLKAIGRVGIGPVIFNISEPLVFGTPIVMNPYIMIPFLGAPIVNVVISYIVFSLGLVTPGYLVVPSTLPGPIGAFLGTMDWRASLVNIALIVLDTLIYLPFVKVYDSQLCKQEAAAGAAA